MSVDPKFTFWFGVLTNILALLAGYSLQHAPSAIAQYAPDAQWCAGVLVQVNSIVLTALAGVSSSKPGPLLSVPAGAVKPVVILAILITGLFALPGNAHAQPRRLAVTGDVVKDIKTDLAQKGVTVPSVKPGDACTVNIFAALDPNNVVPTIQNCLSDANKPFLPDLQAALDSATTFKDQPGVACLTPALAIVKAAVGTPAVTAPDGSVTTPAVLPGVILIFQKFREFVLAGGPAACKTYIKSTVDGAVPL